MIRLAALAAMALVLGGCDDAIHDQLFDPPKSSSTRDAERMQANREKMRSHFTPDGEFRRDIRRIDFKSMTFNTGVNIVHDDQRAVTCWVFAGASTGSSCLPDWMLTAPKGGMAVRP